jgi:hypothetical protein
VTSAKRSHTPAVSAHVRDAYDRAMRTIQWALAGWLAIAAGCHRAPVVAAMEPAAIEASAGALAEDTDFGSATMIVGTDGSFQALLKGTDGKPITKDATGTVTYLADGKTTTVPVTVDAKGVITGAGPKLEADVTDVSYSLTVSGKMWRGTLHVPRGGTEDLVATAKAQAKLPAGKLGPHGGKVQIVGDDRLEIVADRNAGEIRVYTLDGDLKVVDPGERKITLALDDESPQTIVLVPEPQGHFVVGPLGLKNDPVRVTVFVAHGGVTRACIVGYEPGAHLVVVNDRAPRVKIFVAAVDPKVDVKVHEDDDTKVKIDIKEKGHGGAAGVKVHIH